MKKISSLFLYSILMLCFFTLPVKSQFFPEKLYTVDEGLPQSIITAIVKDSYGFLWIGTNEGMARFDGKTFENYTQSNGYPFHLINGIVETKPGVLWVSDYGFGLFELKNGKARSLVFDPTLRNFHVNFLKKERNGIVLLGTDPGGLYVFKNDSLIRHYSDTDEIPGGVLSASKDPEGNIWVGTYANGAVLIDHGKVVRKLTIKNGLPSNEVRSILPLKNGKTWFGTGSGLFVLNDSKISDAFNEKYPHSQIMSVYSPDSVNIYLNVSTQKGGVLHYKNGALEEEIQVNKSIYTKCTYMDKSGVLFIGTYNGLLVLPDRDFINYDSRSGLKNGYIRAVAKDPNGNLWVGTKNNGIFYFKKGRFYPFELRKYGERFRTPYALNYFENQFWIGTRRGLLILENGKSVQNAVTDVADSLEIRKITKIDSVLYLVTRKKIIKVLNGNVTDLTYNLRDSVNSIWGVEKDNKGTLWAATNGYGIWTLKDTVWAVFPSAAAPKHLYGVRKTPSGFLLFPSSVGAFLWDGKELKNIYKKKGNVWDAITGDSLSFWFGTSRGLVHRFGTNQEFYSRKNGYASTEFNIGSFYKDEEQTLWFGGVSGLMHYLGKQKHTVEEMPLVIKSIQSGDSSISFSGQKQKTFQFEKKNISIAYMLITYKMPSEIRYRIFLEGFDADTSAYTTETKINYTNLFAGSYTFHVFAYIGDKSNYYKTTSFTFEIESDWWETWWAIVLYTLLLILIVYYLIHWREKLLRKRNILLEQKIEERMIDLRSSNQRLVNEIKERIRAEKALGEEKEQLAVTLAAITDGVIRLDEMGRIVLMNAVARELCGISQNEAEGKEFNEIFDITDEVNSSPIGLNVLGLASTYGDQPFSQSAILNNKRDGQRLNIYLSIAPIFDTEKQVLGYVVVFRDITSEKKAEEETIRTQKLESIGLLAGGLAHDFNNILSGILGNTQLARLLYEKGDNIEKYLRGIEDSTNSATTLTQQLLTFSKGGEPVKKQIILNKLLEDSVHFTLRGSNVKSAIFIDNKLWPVNVDAGQISQVINNLTINADQAMPNGGTLTIEANNIEVNDENPIIGLETGKYIEIRFIDQGIGISEENLIKIFDPYFTTKQKGSGLGLASSYSIIEKHKGTITVQSKPGQGTTFTIYLPAMNTFVRKNKKESRKIEKGFGKILIMDDESYIRDLMKDMLGFLGYKAETVENGEEAIRKYRDALQAGAPFDAVIMDLTIPGGMGGEEVIRELLKIDPEVKSIVASGYSADSIMANYGDFGFKGILQKPFRIEEVGIMLDEVLHK